MKLTAEERERRREERKKKRYLDRLERKRDRLALVLQNQKKRFLMGYQ
jgi:hypothetical protein